MRVLGVVVVDRRPLDRATEVALHACHQLTDVVREVEIASVLWGHDEPELVPLAQARLLEGLAGHGPLGAVEHAGRAVLLDSVALDVPQVPRGRLGAATSELLQMRFDDDTPRVGPRAEASDGRELRRRPGAEAPVTPTHQRRNAKGARGHPVAPAIGPAEPRSKVVQSVVRVIWLAHHELPSPTARLRRGCASKARAGRATRGLQRSRKSLDIFMG